MVLTRGADLGVVFDTGVDRSGMVDGVGAAINRGRLIALISAIVLAEHPGTTVVTDARAGDGLTRFIEARSWRRLWQHGRQGRASQCRRHEDARHDGELENTGHGALRQNHFLDDCAYMVVKIII